MNVEAIEGVRKIQALFCQYLDDGNLEGTMELFTEDAIIHSGGNTHTGTDQIRTYLTGFFNGTPPDNRWIHMLSDGVYNFSEDGLTGVGRSYMTAYRCGEIGRWWMAAVNRHHDRYRKVDGQWRFAEKGMEQRGHFRRTSQSVPNPLTV
jgi:hypothetical protein